MSDLIFSMQICLVVFWSAALLSVLLSGEKSMELNFSVLISGFVLGLFIGSLASLINMIISAFARWVMS